MKRIFTILATALLLGIHAASLCVAHAERYTVSGYDIPIDVVLNGSYLNSTAKGYLDDGVTDVPVRGLAEAMGLDVLWDPYLSVAIIEKEGVSLLIYTADGCCYVNDAPFYPGIRFENGTLYAPARFLAETLGATVEWDDYRFEVKLTLPGYTVPEGRIETAYNADDLLWLSRITTCESGSVSFDAKIAVANVVLNRRASSSFPDTVHDVVFDKKFGIQFPPAHNGKIYNTPSTNTILACKVAFSGVQVAQDCLYFTYSYDTSSWVVKNCKKYLVIGRQAFYQ